MPQNKLFTLTHKNKEMPKVTIEQLSIATWCVCYHYKRPQWQYMTYSKATELLWNLVVIDGYTMREEKRNGKTDI